MFKKKKKITHTHGTARFHFLGRVDCSSAVIRQSRQYVSLPPKREQETKACPPCLGGRCYAESFMRFQNCPLRRRLVSLSILY